MHPTNVHPTMVATQAALAAAGKLLDDLRAQNIRITFMESCTGGMLAAILTSISGSSEVFAESSVTYANDAKVRRGVDASVIDRYSVYSTQTAEAMAQASVRSAADATVGVAVTGSLTRVDPANPDHSIPGEVFVGIMLNGTSSSYTLTVESADRYVAKLHLATVIFNRLTEQLEHLV